MPSTNENIPNKPRVVKYNDQLQTMFIDSFEVHSRADKMFFLRLMIGAPDGILEQGRFMLHQDRARSFIDLLCKNCNYYPLKPQQENTIKPDIKTEK